MTHTRPLIDWSKHPHPRCQVHVNGEVEQLLDAHETSPPLSVTPRNVPATVYSPLEAWQTRLLRVEPGRYGEPIIVKLLPVDIIQLEGVVVTQTRERLFYEAVSYSWGQLPLQYSIICSGEDFPVTPGVFQALQRLRYDYAPRYLWIDAISINQQDTAEKNLQIRNMFAIFKKAFRVLVWLGELQEPIPGKLVVDYLKYQWAAPNDASCIICQYELYTALVALAKQPFFSRLWVRQEIFVAREIVVHFSDAIMGWTITQTIPKRIAELAKALRSRVSQGDFSQVAWPGGLRQASDEEVALVGTADRGRAAHLSDGDKQTAFDEIDLVRVLLRNKGFKAKDPRDFVYGVIGMTNVDLEPIDVPRPRQSELHNVLPIDYNKSVSEVFQDVARYVIRRDRGLDILFLAWESRPMDTLKLPSWTPDWRSPQLRDWSYIIMQIYKTPSLGHGRSAKQMLDCVENVLAKTHYPGQLPMQNPSPSDVFLMPGIVCGNIVDTRVNVILELRAGLKPVQVAPSQVDLESSSRIGSPSGFRPVKFPAYAKTASNGCVPVGVKEGDKVVAVHGFDLLLLLRSVGGDRHTLVGPVLFHRWLLTGILAPQGRKERERWQVPLHPIADFLWRRRRADLQVFQLA